MTGLPIRPEEREGLAWTADTPCAAAYRFVRTLNQPGRPDLWQLGPLVTPESLDGWGDFTVAQAELRDRILVGPGLNWDEVVYIYAPTAPGDPDAIPDTASAVITVVHRPSLGGWRVHAGGDFVLPDDVPRDPATQE